MKSDAPQSTGWECPRCGHENDSGSKRCETRCGTGRPKAVPLLKPNQKVEQWHDCERTITCVKEYGVPADKPHNERHKFGCYMDHACGCYSVWRPRDSQNSAGWKRHDRCKKHEVLFQKAVTGR